MVIEECLVEEFAEIELEKHEQNASCEDWVLVAQRLMLISVHNPIEALHKETG